MTDRTGWLVTGAAFAALLLAATTAAAQEHTHHRHTAPDSAAHTAAPDSAADQASPYAGLQDRAIAALSAEETAGLLAGHGLGMALPAELHGYPGPRHVLDLAAELELTAEQRARAQAIYDAMHERAVTLGRRVVELERELDAAFETGTVTQDRLTSLLARIGAARAELRGVHLQAHLELRPVLTAEQRTTYEQLRGYHPPDS